MLITYFYRELRGIVAAGTLHSADVNQYVADLNQLF